MPALLQCLRVPQPTPSFALLAAAFLRTVLAFMRPFVSKKAHRKIKQARLKWAGWAGFRLLFGCGQPAHECYLSRLYPQ